MGTVGERVGWDFVLRASNPFLKKSDQIAMSLISHTYLWLSQVV